MQRETTTVDHTDILAEFSALQKTIDQLISSDSWLYSDKKGSRIYEPSRRKSIGETKQQIWGATILAANTLCYRAEESLLQLSTQPIPDVQKLAILNQAETEYSKGLNLFIQSCEYGYQYEALPAIKSTLNHILTIEQQRKNLQKSDYRICLEFLSLKENLTTMIRQEEENKKVYYQNKPKHASASIVESRRINDHATLPEDQKIQDQIILAKRMLSWATSFYNEHSLESCLNSKKLCYRTLADLFLVYERTQNKEAYSLIENYIALLQCLDSWIAQHAKIEWTIDKKFENAAHTVRTIREKRSNSISDFPPQPDTGELALITWQEALKSTHSIEARPPSASQPDRPSSPFKILEKIFKKS